MYDAPFERSSSPLAPRVGEPRKSSDYTVEIPGKLEHNADPTVWATLPEQPFATHLGVGLSILGMFDSQHHSRQKTSHMRMALPNVIQGMPIEFDRTTIRASDKKYHIRRR